MIYCSEDQHFQLTDRRRKCRYTNSRMPTHAVLDYTRSVCVRTGVHHLTESLSLKSCEAGTFSSKGRSFIIFGWIDIIPLEFCFFWGGRDVGLWFFFLYAKFLLIVIETPWLLSSCLKHGLVSGCCWSWAVTHSFLLPSGEEGKERQLIWVSLRLQSWSLQ